jgi:hypothetical protein
MSARASERASASETARASETASASASAKDLIEQFNMYRYSHPNLSQCWVAYLGLKKRHCDAHLQGHCNKILELLAAGQADLKEPDLIRLLLYKHSL